MNKVHCCDQMNGQIAFKCTQHDDVFSCPDSLVHYEDKYGEYGLIIHDGTQSYQIISFCPWCGKKLPESRRERWFEVLDELGYATPFEQEIPDKFKTSEWWNC